MFSTIEQKRYGNDCYDYIYLRNLHLSAAIGKDAWDRAGKAQPAILSLRLQRKVSHAAASDKLEDTTSYGQICKDVMTWVALEKTYADLFEFASHMHYLALSKEWGGTSLQMRTMLPKGSLKAEGGIGFEAVGTMDGEGREIVESSMRFVVNDLKIACIIGVNAHERLAKQTVIVNLQITQDSARVLHVPGSHREHWRGLIEDVTHTVEISAYQTLEALASDIATVSCSRWAVSPITVSVEKPSALAFVDGAGVQITRALKNGIVS